MRVSTREPRDRGYASFSQRGPGSFLNCEGQRFEAKECALQPQIFDKFALNSF